MILRSVRGRALSLEVISNQYEDEYKVLHTDVQLYGYILYAHRSGAAQVRTAGRPLRLRLPRVREARPPPAMVRASDVSRRRRRRGRPLTRLCTWHTRTLCSGARAVAPLYFVAWPVCPCRLPNTEY